MPRVKLTAKVVAALQAPDPSGKQVLHWDTELRGFAVLCSGKTNARAFVVQRDLPSGKTRRLTIASVAELTVEKARLRAADMLYELRQGGDPKKKAERHTLRMALEAYFAARKDLRPASIVIYRRAIEHHLVAWADKPLRDITPELVEARHRTIAAEIAAEERYQGRTTANVTMRCLRAIYSHAADTIPDMPQANPVRRLRRAWFAEPRRERMVRADEMPKFYQAVCTLQNKVHRDFLLLLLFTGLRIGEARTLRWDNIDFAQRVIRLPAAATKSGRKLDLPMSDVVRDMLVSRRALGNATYVFPGPVGHIVDLKFPLAAVARASGIRVSAHDLRRTFITIAESTDISPLALKALVNHGLGKSDTTSGYIIMTVDRLREPAQRVADRIKALCGVEPAAGVAVLKA